MEMKKYAEVTDSLNRGVPCESGLCEQCRVDCQGKCEVFLSALKGRAMLGTQAVKGTVAFGSGNTAPAGISYNALKIRGGLYGAGGIPQDQPLGEMRCLSPRVSLETAFGKRAVTRCHIPVNMGAALNVVSRYWESYAIAAALMGFPLVIGEGSVVSDPELEVRNGQIIRSPRLERMLQPFFRYYDGFGAISVQINGDDFLHGAQTADYISKTFGDRVIIELKLGQGGKSINGEAEILSLDEALRVSERLPVWPDPNDPEVQALYRQEKIVRFVRASSLPFAACRTYEEAEEQFLRRVERLRANGASRLTMKTAGLGLDGLALSLRLASETEMDLVTIDAAGGGTAHSPWQMMEHWGVPALPLHAKAVEYTQRLASRGKPITQLSFAGGFAREDHLFKALALGVPYSPLVTMCRAMIIPGAVGSNVEGALHPERRQQVNGLWDALPPYLKAMGQTPEALFHCYNDVKAKVGAEEMKRIPYGTIAMWTYLDRICTGLRQLMCGARVFSLEALCRDDIAAANFETAKATGIPYIMHSGEALADQILSY